jgi:hypothetical protein
MKKSGHPDAALRHNDLDPLAGHFFLKAAFGRRNRSEAAPFVFKLNPKVFVRVRFEHRSPSREIRDFLRSP